MPVINPSHLRNGSSAKTPRQQGSEGFKLLNAPRPGEGSPPREGLEALLLPTPCPRRLVPLAVPGLYPLHNKPVDISEENPGLGERMIKPEKERGFVRNPPLWPNQTQPMPGPTLCPCRRRGLEGLSGAPGTWPQLLSVRGHAPAGLPSDLASDQISSCEYREWHTTGLRTP